VAVNGLLKTLASLWKHDLERLRVTAQGTTYRVK
jgi:hypothetical protein